MTTPLSINIPHQLGRAEARRRLENGFANLVSQLPGGAPTVQQRWEGDRMSFSVGALGQSVTGVIEVFESSVKMDIQLPALLGMLAGGLKGRLQKAGQLLLTKK